MSALIKPSSKALQPTNKLYILLALSVFSIIGYMTIGANGHWEFIIPFRGTKLAAMLLVAFCVAVSSVLFQTITNNRILTPAIMGFDALYTLIQAIIIFFFGVQGSLHWPAEYKFLAEVLLMTAFSVALFQWIFNGVAKSLHLLVLVGIVFGLLFRSLSSFMVRLIDPNEFLVLQDRMFASFNAIQSNLLLISSIAILIFSLMAWRLRNDYDVLALGRDIAVNLGINYQRTLMLSLVLIAVFVSTSTALVGPVTFFGLLASNLAYIYIKSDKHIHTIPAAILISVILLIGGQTILERIMGFSTPVSVIIEFAGGLMFILLVTKFKK